MIWNLRGNEQQNALVQDALQRCDFPFDRLAPGLAREGKTAIDVDWADLSRYGQTVSAETPVETRAHSGGSKITDENGEAFPIEREVEGRRRVLGLFYLPPNTRVVLDNGLATLPELAVEVFLAEGAHAVDYHYMTPEHRRVFVNAVHQQDLAPGAPITDGVPLNLDGHECGWFDVGPYRMWVGEAMMEGFIEAFAPSVRVTIELGHPVTPEAARLLREALVPPTPASMPVFASNGGSNIYHDSHHRVKHDRTFAGSQEAQAAGYRACKVCKPR